MLQDQRRRSPLAHRALRYLDNLLALDGNRRTVEQLLDAGEQLLRADQNL